MKRVITASVEPSTFEAIKIDIANKVTTGYKLWSEEDDDKYAEYLGELYYRALLKLDPEYPGIFVEASTRGTEGSITCYFDRGPTRYCVGWSYPDELAALAEATEQSASESELVNRIADWVESHLGDATPWDE